MRRILLINLMLHISSVMFSQTILNATADGITYDLITSVLAPGANPIETPDCSHPEFGDHIDMVFDADLNAYVFRFHIHKTPDNDRCINFDRQRNEIKTYSESPANLIGVEGETVEYKWKFKIDANFQASSSFTHLHQLKAVGGSEEGMPLFTLTARKGSPDKLELRYAEHLVQETLHEVDLTPFKGAWVQVVETVTYGETGSYLLKITKVEDGSALMEYSNNSIRMWKTDAEFLRPKWGIYRSLNNPEDLRDEILYFANFMVTEINTTGFYQTLDEIQQFVLYPNPTSENVRINIGNTEIKKLFISDINGKVVLSKYNIEHGEHINLSNLSGGVYFVSFQTTTSLIKTKVVKN